MMRVIIGLALCVTLGCLPAEGGDCAIRNCPADTAVPVKFPVPSDCKLYVTCFKGQIVFGYCSDNTWFDEPSQTCLPPNQANCNHCYSTSRNAPPRAQPAVVHTRLVSTADYEQKQVVTCTNHKFGQTEVFQDHEDLNQYYVCIWGSPVRMRCPTGFHFNDYHEVCVVA